jgi:hypothetical protein
MAKRKEEETQSEGTELNPVDAEETEFQQETVEESNIAKVNLITSEKKVTMSAPVKEFDDFKYSFKSMMTAFANFIEAAGLEIGQDETNAQIIMLQSEFERLRKDTQAGEARIREESIRRDELEEFRAGMEAEEAKRRAESVSRSDLEELKATIEAEEAKNREGLVSQSDLEALKAAIEAEEVKYREGSVPRSEFEEHKAAIAEAITDKDAKLREDYVTRGEFERFRSAVREVI